MVNQTLFQRPAYTLKVISFDGTKAEPQSGIASTEITVDGKKVDSATASCAGTDNCAFNRSWTLKSDEYAVGKHTVVAKVTDGVGLTTEKTLSLTIERDKTPPEILKMLGNLENTPSGWIEQKTYEIKLLAGDVGYGVTSTAFKMDGKIVNETKGTCPDGYCQYFFEAKPDTSVTSVYWVEPAYQCHYGPKTSDGNGGATAVAGHYLRAQAHWKLGHRAKCGGEVCPGENPAVWEDRAIELHLWPSGRVDETVPN
jgi:hypothetical protein